MRLSLLPLHCLEAHGKWEELSVCADERWGPAWQAALELLAPG